MSETPKTTTPKAKAEDQAGQNGAAEVRSAPTQVGRLQQGEKTEGVQFTSRVPRGVGEAPSDALAQHEGLRTAQETVQAQIQDETEKGYRGEQNSPVPNENYTVAGVNAGLPTPETTVYTPRSR